MLWAWGYSSVLGYKQEKGSHFERFFDKKKTIFLWLYPDKEKRKFQLCLFFHPCKISLAFIFNVDISGIFFSVYGFLAVPFLNIYEQKYLHFKCWLWTIPVWEIYILYVGALDF